jgi:hypothetical protein
MQTPNVAIRYIWKGLVSDAVELLQVAVAQEDAVNPPAYGPPMDPVRIRQLAIGPN